MIGGWSFVPGKPVVRGYDTSQLFREDCLERIRHLQAEIDADMQELARTRALPPPLNLFSEQARIPSVRLTLRRGLWHDHRHFG